MPFDLFSLCTRSHMQPYVNTKPFPNQSLETRLLSTQEKTAAELGHNQNPAPTAQEVPVLVSNTLN